MCLDDVQTGRRWPRFGIAQLTVFAALTTLTIMTHAQDRPDERDLTQKRLDAFAEVFAPHFATVDRMSDGGLKEYIAKVFEYTNALGDFVQFLEETPEGASKYRQLIFSAVRRGDWSAVMIIGSAPPSFLLDTWVSEARPGGEFREMFLERMASRDLGQPSHIWEVFEKGRYPYPDFRLHENFMRTHPVEEAAPLVEYMLRTHPLMAMDILLDIYPDQLPDAEPVFDDHWTIKKTAWKYDHGMHRGRAPHETLVALTRLSHHDVWWVRLYALSVTAERGPFKLRWDRPRDLRNDPNDAVKRAVNAIYPPK